MPLSSPSVLHAMPIAFFLILKYSASRVLNYFLWICDFGGKKAIWQMEPKLTAWQALCNEKQIIITASNNSCNTYSGVGWLWKMIVLMYLLTYLPTSWSRVLKKLSGFQSVKKFPEFYGAWSSLPQSQVPTTCPSCIDVHFLSLWCQNFLLNFSTPKRHFEERKTEIMQHV
jgi:hypothetical protein